MSIQSLLGSHSAEVFTIRATATVKSAAEQMRQHGIGALAVKSDDVIKGLISDRDILYAVSRRGEAAISLAVSQVMSHALVTVSPDDSLKRAMNLMVHHRLRDLAVMADGKVVGVVNMSDVAKYRLEDLETESNVLRDALHRARRREADVISDGARVSNTLSLQCGKPPPVLIAA